MRGLRLQRRAFGWFLAAATVALAATLLFPLARAWLAGAPHETGVDTRAAGFYALTQRCIDGAAAGNLILASDCATLLQAKDALGGATTLDWSAGAPMSGWEGITLGGMPQRVTGLELAGAGLDGAIPPALGRLDALEVLDLAGNVLTGGIPPELGALSRLSVLDVSGNALGGVLPPELGRLDSLIRLAAGGNRLAGGIPASLFAPRRLDYVDLSGNELTGAIPPVAESRPDMRGLLLAGNRLSGPLPLGLWDLDLSVLMLGGNRFTGCIPQGLREPAVHDLGDLGLQECAATSTYVLAILAGPHGRVSPPPGLYRYPAGSEQAVTVSVTPRDDYDVARWTGDCAARGRAAACTLVMDGDRTAHVVFTRSPHRLRVTTTGEGTVTPGGDTWIRPGHEVTLRASWDDATHDFGGWGGDCEGTAQRCVLTMGRDREVTATFTELPADRCQVPTAADCIRAVYRGGPGDHAQVSQIPPERLLRPDARGRYRLERGQQVTVVTAGPLPEGYTQLSLERSPGEAPSPVSYERAIRSDGTAYTFTPSTDAAGTHLIAYELRAARPHPRPQPGRTLEHGAVVVRTEFVIPTLRYDLLDATGAAAVPGSYAFLNRPGDSASAIGTTGSLEHFDAVELRIHPVDASGTSRTSLYGSVGVGDSLDYRLRHVRCGIRLRVTSVGPAASPLTFGVEYVSSYGGECQSLFLLPGAAGEVEFEWGVPPGVPGSDGVRVMLPFEPAGEGTYRVHAGLPWVIDVPPGIHVSGGVHQRVLLDAGPNRPPGSSLSSRAAVLPLDDVETDARLAIATVDGAEAARYDTTPAVDALFDRIAASVRYREVPRDDPASLFEPASAWRWTVTCDGEREPIVSRTEPSKASAMNSIWLNQQLACATSSTYTLSPAPRFAS